MSPCLHQRPSEGPRANRQAPTGRGRADHSPNCAPRIRTYPLGSCSSSPQTTVRTAALILSLHHHTLSPFFALSHNLTC